MTDYSELVIDLRDADTAMMNWKRLSLDAAAAIEALQAEVDTLNRTDSKRCQECLYLGQPVGEQLLPKRGEWIEENRRPRSSQFVCSECHRTAYDPQPTRDKAWRKRCKYAYCPNCGAKMGGTDERRT